jgi:hypothetical protein
MTPHDIKTAICISVLKARGCNEIGAAHYEGLLRGLIWTLNGVDPGRLRLYRAEDLKDMFDVAGIPARLENRPRERILRGDPCK